MNFGIVRQIRKHESPFTFPLCIKERLQVSLYVKLNYLENDRCKRGKIDISNEL